MTKHYWVSLRLRRWVSLDNPEVVRKPHSLGYLEVFDLPEAAREAGGPIAQVAIKDCEKVTKPCQPST